MNSTTNDSSPKQPDTEHAYVYRTVLLAINVLVLVSGTISLSLMMHILKSSSTSITSIAVLNLIFAHFIFLITVPFRIYYYVSGNWELGHSWCKVVSSMIHIHMYMSFFLYVIILITRLLTFYRKAEQLAPFRSIHALLVSAAVWVMVLSTVPFVIHFAYGKNQEKNLTQTTNETVCFKFGKHIHKVFGATVVNYVVSTLIIVVAAVLTALQANVLRVLYRRHRQGCISQQDFGAQLKSMCFALIMVVCFIPYHMFRLYYLEHINLQQVNEVLLSLTTFNCLDMLTFLGRRNCYMCFFRRVR
ncbi:probable G-protein coupled receptor 141 [Paralichthys olivaceus]|uniref:probable G-protein coupled receptor 141 n=1 Tax=Paralichthys olivaceus TaxID=8255 RepID=UPI00097DAF5B|nr:PREDICTED: probable G-protein coupled receptor 141 [Paralichthys olivaceus]